MKKAIWSFKGQDRNENEGNMEGFKMNKSESDLRNLTDLAYVL